MFIEFDSLNWAKVAYEINKYSILVERTPTKVIISSYPYGRIEIYSNGGVVNIVWENVPGLKLNLAKNQLKVWRYELAYSVPLSTNEKKVGKLIKEALDKAIAEAIKYQPVLYIPKSETHLNEVRVIKDETKDTSYLIQVKNKSNWWEVYRPYDDMLEAINEAYRISLRNSKRC